MALRFTLLLLRIRISYLIMQLELVIFDMMGNVFWMKNFTASFFKGLRSKLHKKINDLELTGGI